MALTSQQMVDLIDERVQVLLGKPKKYAIQSENSNVLSEHYSYTELLQLRQHYAKLVREEAFGTVAKLGLARFGK